MEKLWNRNEELKQALDEAKTLRLSWFNLN